MCKTFLIILCSLLISTQCLLTKANECAFNTECKHLSECPQIRNSFVSLLNKPYCNLNQKSTYVCCLKEVDTRSERECKSYQKLRPSFETPLIVGGKKADPKEYPFMALLYYKNGNSDNVWMCGGTLISNKYVLTAAHCLFKRNIPNYVRLGELDYSTDKDDARPVDIAIKSNITHPQYFTTDIQTKYNDIALVELVSEVQFNEYIMPACLPLVDGSEFSTYYAAGWGSTRDTAKASTHLLKVKLDRFDDSTCASKVEITEQLKFGVNNRTQMCAGSFTDNRDTCYGDSGGPLFVDHPQYECLFLVLGITSYGESGCGVAGQPGVYTRITLYLDWIEQIVWKEAARLS